MKRRVLGLQLKVSLTILIPMLIILILSSYIGYGQQRERALASMSLLASQAGEVIENALQEDMARSNFDRVQSTIDAIAQDERVGRLFLIDPTGRVIFAPQGEGVGQVLDNRDETCQPCHNLASIERPSGIVATESDGQRYFRSMHPIENRSACHACHDPEQKLIGLLLTDFSISPVEQALSADLRTNLIWWIGSIILLVVLVNIVIHRMLIRRIQKLSTAISSFGQNESVSRLPETPMDELGTLSASFNRMSNRIKERSAENEALSDELRVRNDELAQLLKRLINAQEDERKRVARELHDELGQALTSTAMRVETALKLMGPDQAKAVEILQHSRTIIAQSTDHIHDLIMGLRPSSLDELGLETAMRAHAKRVLEPAGIVSEIRFDGLDGRLPSEVETTLFRVFQEALTNILRHAKAKTVSIHFKREEGSVVVEIRDDGVGFDVQESRQKPTDSTGLGILGMRERIEQYGGEIQIRSEPGAGTHIHLSLPIK